MSRRRAAERIIPLDRSLEGLPLFRLSDSADGGAITYCGGEGERWRVLPRPGDRLPGTFDQDVYVELLRRYHEAGDPPDGGVTFTLHAFLRSTGRRVDGRTYAQLRGALGRLEHTTLESHGGYQLVRSPRRSLRFTLLSSVVLERRRAAERDQLALFPALAVAEPGVARVTLAAPVRENLAARHLITLSAPRYWALASPVARRLYRLLEWGRGEDGAGWRVPLAELAERLPLAQRFPSHLQRVLRPAHEMLRSAGIIRSASVRREGGHWRVEYRFGSRSA